VILCLFYGINENLILQMCCSGGLFLSRGQIRREQLNDEVKEDWSMKKLLALMLVLGMVSAANAALVISLDGATDISSIEIHPSDTVTVDIFDTLGANWLAYLDFYNESEGTYSLSNVVWREAAGDGSIDWSGYSLNPSYDAYEYEVTQAWGTTTTKLAGSVWSVDLHCEKLGNVYIELLDDDFTTILDTATIYQVPIPEPMTIALLGLGGLFLRRRK
jgi:hypothetical protein